MEKVVVSINGVEWRKCHGKVIGSNYEAHCALRVAGAHDDSTVETSRTQAGSCDSLLFTIVHETRRGRLCFSAVSDVLAMTAHIW